MVDNYYQRNAMLKRIIQKKAMEDPNLPSYKVLLRMIANGRSYFNPTNYLNGDWSEYLYKLRCWKLLNEDNVLKDKPYLRGEPKRHIKSKVIVVCD